MYYVMGGDFKRGGRANNVLWWTFQAAFLSVSNIAAMVIPLGAAMTELWK